MRLEILRRVCVCTIVLWWLLCMGLVAEAMDPYRILKVPRKASHDEIRRAYRSLCLRYHPDKNVHLSPEERKQCEETFKDIQKAHSLIGNEESRRNYDTLSRYGQPYGSSASRRRSYAQYMQQPFSAEQIFHDIFRQQQGFNRAPSFRASAPPDLFDLSNLKCVYVQSVPVTLEDLYSGKTGFSFFFSGSLWQRLSGAFRGGLGFALLYQSILFALPMIRFSKAASFLLGMYVFFSHLPKPSRNSFYADLKAGYKDGTRFIFTEDGSEVVFVLKEQRHSNFVRQGNHLYTTVYLSSRQARRGTTVQTKHLDGSSIRLKVPAGTRPGYLIKVQHQGWPGRRGNRTGDLFVQIRIKSSSRSRSGIP